MRSLALLFRILGLALLIGCGKPQSNQTSVPMSFSDKLLKDRIVFLGSPISDEVGTEVIAKMLFLQSQSSNQPIALYINSPGGSVAAGLAILSTMETLAPKVHTVCVGQAHSMAAIILTCGSAGNRYAVTNAFITFSNVRTGDISDAEKQKQIERMQSVLVEKTMSATGLVKAKVEELFNSEEALTAAQAHDLNIIDQIVVANARAND